MSGGYDYATKCRYCGTTYYPNMYGMGNCSGCGYTYHPINPIIEMQKNERWTPPTKEQPVGMTDYEGSERVDVPGRDMKQDQKEAALAIVAKGILDGKFDKDLHSLQDVILTRQRVRKDEVAALVQEVYGENYTINTTKR